MKKVFIIHGFGGTPNGGWIPWLMEELAKKNIYACALPMPDSKTPLVSKWVEEISHAVNNAPDDEVFLIGHSLGVPAILRYLEYFSGQKKISGALLMSGLINPLNNKDPESKFRTIDPFVIPEIDFNKIKNKANKFVVFHSTDDPTVSFSNAEKISSMLNCELVKVDTGGHFYILSEPICYEIPEILEILNDMLGK